MAETSAQRGPRSTTLFVGLGLGLLCCSTAAQAYVGPGLGTGVLASVLGVLAGLGMLVVGLIWYPIKRLINWMRGKR